MEGDSFLEVHKWVVEASHTSRAEYESLQNLKGRDHLILCEITYLTNPMVLASGSKVLLGEHPNHAANVQN